MVNDVVWDALEATVELLFMSWGFGLLLLQTSSISASVWLALDTKACGFFEFFLRFLTSLNNLSRSFLSSLLLDFILSIVSFRFCTLFSELLMFFCQAQFKFSTSSSPI